MFLVLHAVLTSRTLFNTMKTLAMPLVLVALACGLVVSAEESRGTFLRKPLVLTVEKQNEALLEARRYPKPLMRLPFPAGDLGLKEHPKIAPVNKAKPSFLFKARDESPEAKANREPQPDIAGRVSVQSMNANLDIVHGQKAVLGQIPWQAGLLLEMGNSSTSWCGGSIVHSRWILTAAHCVDFPNTRLTVSVGSLGSQEGNEPSRQVFQGVNEIYQHPAYNSYFIDNDIAFIKLPIEIVFSAYARPVRLPSWTMATDMMAGTTGIVSGWGKTSNSDAWITNDLMYVQNTIGDGQACFEYFGNVWIPNKICVPTPDHHNFCNGDSGGPLTFVEADGITTQLGIVSFRPDVGCTVGLSSVFTRVASFLHFIEDTTNILIRD